jgi:hypothetical protein
MPNSLLGKEPVQIIDPSNWMIVKANDDVSL